MTGGIVIVGGGISGLTLALSLHQAGIPCRVYEAAPDIAPLGFGINLLPHAMRELTELGLHRQLAAVAVATREYCYYNRFGQFIFKEPRGRFDGYEWPQLSIHRGDLQAVLLEAVRARLGPDSVALNRKCIAIDEDASGVTAHFEDRSCARGAALIGCDGVRSAVRKILHPNEGPLSYQGINMWLGMTRWKPFLTGASMIMAGWLDVGKMVIYPISNRLDGQGRQLINWTAMIQSPRNVLQDWSNPGRLEDFHPAFENWRFDWLDVAGMLRGAEQILEYPMVDREPLPFWTRGRVALAGDAAHPMYPRGSNGAGQAILDVRALAGCLKREAVIPAALGAYEQMRLKAANDVVLANRTSPPDVILREVHERTGDRPFQRIEDVIAPEELAALSASYKRLAGFDRDSLSRRPSFL